MAGSLADAANANRATPSAGIMYDFPVGRAVEISGLRSKPELNGRRATVVGFQGDRVCVDVGGGDQATVAVRPANLRSAEDVGFWASYSGEHDDDDDIRFERQMFLGELSGAMEAIKKRGKVEVKDVNLERMFAKWRSQPDERAREEMFLSMDPFYSGDLFGAPKTVIVKEGLPTFGSVLFAKGAGRCGGDLRA
eukprot:gene40344-35214_t